eukprot:Awhi_evm3s14288
MDFADHDGSLKLSLRRGSPLSRLRAAAANSNNLEKYYPLIKQVMEEHDIGETDIWNIDEIVCARNSKSVSKISHLYGEQGKHVTGICFIKADGTSSPATFIFPGKEQPSHKNIQGCKDFNENSLCFASEKGWVNNYIFYEMLQKWIKDELPPANERGTLLLLMDGHGSHTTLPVAELCKANKIEIILPPPHTSHINQPLDLACFGELKKLMGTLLPVQRNGIEIHQIPVLLKPAFELAFAKDVIVKGFENAGIVPLRGVEAVDPNLLQPSESLAQLAGY